MVQISPILNNRLNNNLVNNSSNFSDKAHHEKVYENLQTHANDVKPNAPKAKLIKENPIQACISYFKDTAQDVSNFFKATQTGKLNDNSLGRLNDLGLKFGAAIIATFLAAHAKTKTEAAMKFIGVGSFFASMKLWPALFINLPARLMHGFDIGQRYISAQGDKKDFFLDNQFLPWDAYSDEELAKIGKYNGIDINSKNGKEKIQRKMQKVALQNRTLWMATAGFATPLMTALFCDAVEPHVKNAITNHQFKKSLKDLDNLSAIFKDFDKVSLHPGSELKNIDQTKAKEFINSLFENANYQDDKFFAKLVEALRFDKLGLPKEEMAPFSEFAFRDTHAIEVLKKMYSTGKLKITSHEALEEAINECCRDNPFVDAGDLIEEIKNFGNNVTLDSIKSKLSYYLGDKDSSELISNLLNGENGKKPVIVIDGSKFKRAVENFYIRTTLPTREKFKSLLKTLNSTIGNTAESKTTQLIVDGSLEALLKKVKPDKQTLEKLRTASDKEAAKILSEFFSELAGENKFGSKEYKKVVNEILQGNTAKDRKQLLDKIFNKLDEALKHIGPKGKDSQELAEALNLKSNSSLTGSIIPKYIQEQKTNVSGFISRAIICLNFETRLKQGLIKVNGQDIRENKQYLAAAKKIIYEGNQSLMELQGSLHGKVGFYKARYRELMDALFNEEAFKNEPQIVQETAKGVLKSTGEQKEVYLRNLNFAQQFKDAATRVCNNKNWKRIFIPAAITLVVVTLLAQPFFGKIKKEYSEKKEVNNNDK